MKKFLIWLSGMIAMPFITLFVAFVFVKALGFSITTATSFLGDSDDIEFILGVWGFLFLISALGWTGSFINWDSLSDEKKIQFRSGSGISCDFCGQHSDKPFFHDGGSRDICSDCVTKASTK